MLHGLDLLRQQYKKYAEQRGLNSSPSSTITILSERLSDPAQTRENQRATVLSLKSLVRDHADQVSEHALVPLLSWIKTKSNEGDEETLRAAVECCLALCQAPSDDPRTKARASKNMTRLLEEKDALLTILTLLSLSHGFYTRFGALQLLVLLVENRRLEVQDYVLTAPGGSSSVLQCLEAAPSSSTEIIRNEALLLLPPLVKDNADIQKIVAFEGAFERLLDIIVQEGRIEGGVVVQDALDGLEALLLHNVSNQNYFRETLSIPLLGPLLFYPPPLPPQAPDHARHEYATHQRAFLLQEWDEQKLSNAHILLRCIRHLIDGQGDGHKSNRLAMCKTGLAEALVQLSMASLAPPALKADTLHVIAALLRGSRDAQEMISAMVITPVSIRPPSELKEGQPPIELAWEAPQPAMLRLISMALRVPTSSADADMALRVRCSALQAVEALIEQNMDIRMTLWHAFVAAPTPDQTDNDSAGLLLNSVAHLPSTTLVASNKEPQQKFDPYQHLFAATILGYILHGSETSKEFARRVCLNDEGRCVADARVPSSTDDDEPATLVHVVVGNLAMALREHGDAVRRERAAQAGNSNTSADWTKVIVGYLALLSVWLWQSPPSIADLLSESANLQVLIQPAAQTTGVDPLIQGLSAFVLGTAYEFNALQATSDQSDEVLTRQAMHPILHSRIGADQFSSRIQTVKHDARFAACAPETLEMVGKPQAHTGGKTLLPDIWFTWPFVEFWKDNYVRIQKSILQAPEASESEPSTELLDARQRLMTMEAQLARAQADAGLVETLRESLAQAQEAANLAQNEHAATQAAREAAQHELEAAHQMQTALQNEWKAEQDALRAEHALALEAHEKTKAQLASACADIETLRTQLSHGRGIDEAQEAVSQRALEAARQETATEQAHVAHLQHTIQQNKEHVHSLQSRVATLEHEVSEARTASTSLQDDERIKVLQMENEDLLVLLDELMLKRKSDKTKMRDAGWDVSEDEDDEEIA